MPPLPSVVGVGGGLASAAAGVLLVLGHLLNLVDDSEFGTVLGDEILDHLVPHVVP